VLPHLRAQGGGRIVQLSSYGGQVAYPGNSMYHATKWGIEGFVESVAQEVAPFGIGMTLVEPGGARTEFRYGSARVADQMPEYDDNPRSRSPSNPEPRQRARPRRPGSHGGRNHRKRRPGAGSPARDARLRRPQEHPLVAAGTNRRLRGTRRARRLDRLSPGAITTRSSSGDLDHHLAESAAFTNAGQRLGHVVESKRAIDVNIDLA
jgi:short chain dehydrogenase